MFVGDGMKSERQSSLLGVVVVSASGFDSSSIDGPRFEPEENVGTFSSNIAKYITNISKI